MRGPKLFFFFNFFMKRHLNYERNKTQKLDGGLSSNFLAGQGRGTTLG